MIFARRRAPSLPRLTNRSLTPFGESSKASAKHRARASHGICATIRSRLQQRAAIIARSDCHNRGRSLPNTQSAREGDRDAHFPHRTRSPQQIGGGGGFLRRTSVFDDPAHDGVCSDRIRGGVTGVLHANERRDIRQNRRAADTASPESQCPPKRPRETAGSSVSGPLVLWLLTALTVFPHNILISIRYLNRHGMCCKCFG